MDDKNEGLKDRWSKPGHVPERGYVREEPDVERQTREIRSDIVQARADMSETIDAIQDKLRPGSLVSQATETVRNATVERVKGIARSASDRFRGADSAGRQDTYRIRERIGENPIPAAIAAASLAWIAFSGRRARRASPAIYGSTRGDDAFIRETTISEYGEDDHDVAVRQQYGTDAITERARSAVQESGRRVRRTASTAQERLMQFLRDNPVAAGAVAAAVGATVGVALPDTRRENELMGETRDAVVDQAQEAARGAAERVKDAARQVQDVATEAAKKVTGD